MLLSDDRTVVYVAYDKKLLAIDPRDGTSKWAKTPKFRGHVHQLSVLPGRLLVKGGPDVDGGGKPFIDLLDPMSGESLWKREFKKLKANKTTNYIIEGDDIVVYSDKKLLAVRMEDGHYAELAKGLRFGGGETPIRLTARNNAYLLVSAQNLMSVGPDGNPIFHTYLEAPKASSLVKVASFLATAGIAIAGAMATQGFIVVGNRSYYLMPMIFFDTPEYGQTAGASDFLCVLTNLKSPGQGGGRNGPALVQVDKDTGRPVAGVFVEDKDPLYALDAGVPRVFYVQDDTTLVCAEF
jgi:hypothetical protein